MQEISRTTHRRTRPHTGALAQGHFAETSGGDVYFVKMSHNGSIYYCDNVFFYDHDVDECNGLTEYFIVLYRNCVVEA